MRWCLPATVIVVGLASAGCGQKFDDNEGVWLEGFEFGWSLFNHRLSHLQVQVQEPGVTAAIVGGTSTTSVVPEPLEDACDIEGCLEFPFADTSELSVSWGRAVTTRALMVPTSADLLVGRDGQTVTVSVAVDAKKNSEVVAILQGVTLNTDHELSGGPSCYRPEYGWHPRAIEIELGAERIDDTVEVDVFARFHAGDTQDPDRQCIDAINDQAVVPMTIDVLVVVGAPVEVAQVSTSAAYPFSGNVGDPGDQERPASSSTGLDGTDAMLGWTRTSFEFNPDSGDDRGAYLRTLGFLAEPDGSAVGLATNYSLGTQLFDFAYTFEGTIARVEIGEGVTRGQVDGVLATVDDLDQTLVTRLGF